jgi:hypothetical protein
MDTKPAYLISYVHTFNFPNGQARLTLLEKSHKQLEVKLQEKERTIQRYERGDVLMQNNSQVISSLEEENASLKQKISEMESFLADYGLTWVGGSTSGERGSDNNNPSILYTESVNGSEGGEIFPLLGGGVAPPPDVRIDTKRLISQLKYLNDVASETETKLVSDPVTKKAKFVKTAPVPIIVFQNGIFLFRGPFRPYHLRETKRFVADVFDGYFPFEFRDSHPNGVIFGITDKSDELYEAKKSFEAFSGRGRKVTDPRTLADIGDQTIKLDVNQFLSRLPVTKISSNGTLVSVRADIEEKLFNKEQISVSNSPDRASMGASKGCPGDATSEDSRCNSVIIIKTSDGKRTVTLKLQSSTSTVRDLYNYVNEEVYNNVEIPPYEIRTAFPKRSYTNMTELLEDAGLAGGSNVFIHLIK